MKNKNIGLVILIFIGTLITTAWVMGILTGIALSVNTIVEYTTWKDKTTPLDEDVVQHLCSVFELSLDDPLCSVSDEIYGPDFFPIVFDTFIPKDGEWATFDEVETRIGDYNYYCEDLVTTGDGIEYFRCSYDFNTDRMFPVVIFYYSDNTIMKIIAKVTN